MSIALTFDDGPNNTTTPTLLDFLEKEHIPATFFVLGEMVKKNSSVLKRIASSGVGHLIGNHSWSHPDFTTLTDAELTDQLSRTQKIIEDTIGSRSTKLMRPPYGAFTKPHQKQLIEGMGYEIILWNVNSNDTVKGFPREAGPIAGEISKGKDGSIILIHDIHPYSVEATKIAVPALKKRSCTFATAKIVKSQVGAVSCTR
jgi:peptidoglycan/xylan/chitin deacetylase (PgdA/CDA1 family)